MIMVTALVQWAIRMMRGCMVMAVRPCNVLVRGSPPADRDADDFISVGGMAMGGARGGQLSEALARNVEEVEVRGEDGDRLDGNRHGSPATSEPSTFRHDENDPAIGRARDVGDVAEDAIVVVLYR